MKKLITNTDSIKVAQKMIAGAEKWSYDDSESLKSLGPTWARTVAKRWKARGRQVLSMHPELAEEVALATSDPVYPEVFRAIPYINPMVVFPEPIDVDGWNLLGFFTHGMAFYELLDDYQSVTREELDGRSYDLFPLVDDDDGGVRRSGLPIRPGERMLVFDTDQPQADYFNTLLVLESKTGVRKLGRLVFPLDGPPGTIEEIVKSHSPIELDPTRAYSIVLGTLLYLASTVLDTETVPRSATRKANVTSKPIALTNVGWRIGPALTKFRREATKDVVHLPSGRTMPPHQRRAHFALRWTGPGRTIPKMVFIAPTWIHPELLDQVDTKTVRRIGD